ncbi:hypothetical protein OROGR_018049 [Orobanche gracilis]
MMESIGTSSKGERIVDFRCVQCGFPTKTLYIQYSPGNIRLMKCENCKAVADEYIECEVMILIIDLILHKPKAYRHLFYNISGKETITVEHVVEVSLDISYFGTALDRMWVLSRNEMECLGPVSVASSIQEFGKMLAGVIFGNLAFHCVVFLAARVFLSASDGFYGSGL